MHSALKSTTWIMGLLAALALAVPAFAEPAAAWDQERVTKIAAELADQVGTIKEDLRKMNPPPAGGQRRAHYNALEEIRLIRNSTRHLAKLLAEGEGHDATEPVFRRIRVLARDVGENIRRSAVIPDDVMASIDKGRDLLLQMAPYYEAAEG